MTIDELKKEIDIYNNGDTSRNWVMDESSINYTNDFLTIVRIDSSNRWIGLNKMSKEWSIIFRKKNNFEHLKHYKELQKVYNIKVTPVRNGINKGCYGLRIYDMTQNPTVRIIKLILDFIFQE